MHSNLPKAIRVTLFLIWSLSILSSIAGIVWSITAQAAVIEFYNRDLDNYFITADPVEQAMVDTGAVGRWQRTGNAFATGGPNQVCRFYGNGNINPATGTFYGPNSHFYTADAAECADLEAQYTPNAKSWKFESNDFLTTPAASGACPAGLTPVYRAYNNGFARGIDSNHRITSNYAAYLQTVAAGAIGEGVVMCAPLGNPPAAQNSAQALEEVALDIYDSLVARQDLKPYISGVMTAFGVPPLGDADVATADARFSQGLPLMFIPQVAEMADAFNDGGYISLDSFIAAANAQGAKQKGSTNPLTRDYLNQKFAAFAGKTQYTSGEVLPAFVLALGKERAKRFPRANPDPLWGDGLLDPLQLTLMLYAVSYSSAAPLPAQASWSSATAFKSSAVNPIEDFVKDKINDHVTGAVGEFIEIPLTKKDAAQVSVCASLLLYGHKMKVTATPKLIYHHQTDGTVPWVTQVNALLTFQDDYWDNYLQIDHWLLTTLGNCTLPRRGPVAGKPLEYSVSDGLIDHGNWDVLPAATNSEGESLATWRTVLETTPKDQRTFANQRDAVGAVIVRAGSLVPGWSTLERIVGVLKDTGNTGDAPLTVIYYQSTKRWTGTGSSTLTINGATASTAAQVTWTLFRTATNADGTLVEEYRGSGTTNFARSDCSVEPASTAIDSATASLFIDYSTTPPKYYGNGTSGWIATYSCPITGPYTAAVVAPFFGGSGPYPYGARGLVSLDGVTIEGSDSDAMGISFQWRFTRDP